MYHHYRDIRIRIPEPPIWWDEHGVPRYDDFQPNECADIYATEVVLLEIECQACRRRFHVAMSHDRHLLGQNEDGSFYGREHPSFADNLGALHYGDPPNAGCCDAGPTMNSVPLRVLEFWRREDMKWTRHPEHEVRIEEDVDGSA